MLKLSSISFTDSSKAVQLLFIVFFFSFIFFMLSSPGDINVKNLAFIPYFGGMRACVRVCAYFEEGGNQDDVTIQTYTMTPL